MIFKNSKKEFAMKKFEANQLFDQSLKNNDHQIIKQLLEEGFVDQNYEFGLYYASEMGFYEIVELLINVKSVDVEKYNAGFYEAASFGYYNIVELYIKSNKVSPSKNNNQVIIITYENYMDTLKDINDYGEEQHIQRKKRFNTLIDVDSINYIKTLKLLYSIKSVKKSLLTDHSEAYNFIIKYEIEKKIHNF